jgi:hypothetical protein
MMTFISDEASKRLLRIEDTINSLADDKLLVWEHEQGFQTGMDQRRIATVVDPLKALYRMVLRSVFGFKTSN